MPKVYRCSDASVRWALMAYARSAGAYALAALRPLATAWVAPWAGQVWPSAEASVQV